MVLLSSPLPHSIRSGPPRVRDLIRSLLSAGNDVLLNSHLLTRSRWCATVCDESLAARWCGAGAVWTELDWLGGLPELKSRSTASIRELLDLWASTVLLSVEGPTRTLGV